MKKNHKSLSAAVSVKYVRTIIINKNITNLFALRWSSGSSEAKENGFYSCGFSQCVMFA